MRGASESRDASGESFVPIAEVVKAVGLKGEVKLYPLLDWYAPLLESRYLVREDGCPLEIVQWRPVGGCAVVRIRNSEDRDAAEALVGERVGFWRARYEDADFPRPAAGLPFRFLGRSVQTTDGRQIGPVTEVRRYGSQLTLVVAVGGAEILIPAVEPILRHDPGLHGPLLVDPPEGLIDVAGD